eukprot:CAMPEP_0118851262 /NCGR_PEP_ID=MMETSP1163-20130328/772_1 /TAXON_ID=124430 /ORGANISM="Phaeomonas parva, Strain CCMP2877" /LENGTH=238 /DNA_ID=CAMNT_0006783571 /DNA_START=249 /DNA_END=965 /DNA_ORIENTATION=+
MESLEKQAADLAVSGGEEPQPEPGSEPEPRQPTAEEILAKLGERVVPPKPPQIKIVLVTYPDGFQTEQEVEKPKSYMDLQVAFARAFPTHSAPTSLELPDGSALDPNRVRDIQEGDVVHFREYRFLTEEEELFGPPKKPAKFEKKYGAKLAMDSMDWTDVNSPHRKARRRSRAVFTEPVNPNAPPQEERPDTAYSDVEPIKPPDEMGLGKKRQAEPRRSSRRREAAMFGGAPRGSRFT